MVIVTLLRKGIFFNFVSEGPDISRLNRVSSIPETYKVSGNYFYVHGVFKDNKNSIRITKVDRKRINFNVLRSTSSIFI